MLKVILIDDEYYALQGLKFELKKFKNIDIVGMFQNYSEAKEFISKTNVDVVFLDIEMPEKNGLICFEELLETQSTIEIVFVTAFNEYAIKAFELNAMDYLLKPVTFNRLKKTIKRISTYNLKIKKRNSIKYSCFKHFEIYINNEPFNIKWRTKKAEEVLSYLICEKGKFVSKIKLAEDLWGELAEEKGLSNLYLVLHYLKKVENEYNISFNIESIRGKMRILYDKIDCDLKVFDKGKNVINNITDENAFFVENAISIYRGQLLESNYYEWTTFEQSKYDNDYEIMVKKYNSFVNSK